MEVAPRVVVRYLQCSRPPWKPSPGDERGLEYGLCMRPDLNRGSKGERAANWGRTYADGSRMGNLLLHVQFPNRIVVLSVCLHGNTEEEMALLT